MTETSKVTHHTPRPWHVYNEPLRPQLSMAKIIEVQRADGSAVIAWAGFDSCDIKAKEKLANAHLIALAPDLLSADRVFLEPYKELSDDTLLSITAYGAALPFDAPLELVELEISLHQAYSILAFRKIIEQAGGKS